MKVTDGLGNAFELRGRAAAHEAQLWYLRSREGRGRCLAQYAALCGLYKAGPGLMVTTPRFQALLEREGVSCERFVEEVAPRRLGFE